MMKSLLTLAICSTALSTAFANPPGRGPGGPGSGPNLHQPPPNVCSHEQLRRAEEIGEHRTLERVRSDLSAMGSAQVTAAGPDDESCYRLAESRSSSYQRTAIDQCNSQATYFKGCEYTGVRRLSTWRIGATVTTSQIKVGKDEDHICRSSAEAKAEREAVDQCERENGVSCQLTARAYNTTYRQDKEGVINRKEVRYCGSTAEAYPTGNISVKCSVEVQARNFIR